MTLPKEIELARLRWIFKIDHPSDGETLSGAGVDVERLPRYGSEQAHPLIHEMLVVYYICASRAQKRYELLAGQFDASAGELPEKSWTELGFSRAALELARPSVELLQASLADVQTHIRAFWDGPGCPDDATIERLLIAARPDAQAHQAA